MADASLHVADVLVLGGGPGGYTAAFRAADLGKSVVLVDRAPELGGVCLHVGCIPSKALLHAASVIDEARALRDSGIVFAPPTIDVARLRARKEDVVATLAGGLAQLAKQRGVTRVTGTGRFSDAHEAVVETAEGVVRVRFGSAIIAVGSAPLRLPGLPDDPRIVDSTGALALPDVPHRLLVVGGGIIGLEMATVYAALGSEVTIVEREPQLMPGCDPELVRVLQRTLSPRVAGIHTRTRIEGVELARDGVRVRFDGEVAPANDSFDRVLIAVGRRALGDTIDAHAAGVAVDAHGQIAVDATQRSNAPHVYAIGDVTGPPQLAHKAMHEAKVAAEVVAGLPAAFDARAIPSVAYTDPEIAWAGLTETEARTRGIPVERATFPWTASGRALGAGRTDGLTKLLFAPDDGRLLGAGIVGIHAGELIAECVLAIEMGADARDLALAIHAHPTLSETIGLAAEVAEGTITDLMPSKRPRRP